MAPPKETNSVRANRRLVLVPYPSQGHINPMLQLATLLHSQGFSITIVHTNYNAPDPATYREFTFASIPVEAPSTKDPAEFILSVNASVEESLRERLEKMVVEDREVPICLVVDSVMYSAKSAAEKVGLPMVSLKTGSAASMNAYHSLLMSWEKDYHRIQDHKSNTPVIEIPHYSARDLSVMVGSKRDEVHEILSLTFEGLESTRALILNTVEALETAEIAALQHTIQCPVYPIGPLHCFAPTTTKSLWVEDRTCIEWLDQSHRHSKSVLYVSFGSIACMDREELTETAWGLADSGQPFLWVLRDGSVRHGTTELPEGFEEATRGRGKVVRWAPQQEVLRHPAVGGFWTHCGWNSTLESVWEGVPMMCSPCFADQPVNARFVARAWRVGISLPYGFERGEIQRVVRRLMVEEEGREMRKRAVEMKGLARLCVANGGTSQLHLEKLVDHIMSVSGASR